MKISKGLNLEQDEVYDPSKEARANLNDAGRNRTSTEQGMDDMLFGKAAVRRRPRAAEQQPKTVNPHQNEQQKKQTKISNETLEISQQKIKSQKQVKSSTSLAQTIQKAPFEPKKKEGAYEGEKKKNTISHIKTESRLITDASISDGKGGFNRPNYIRKLKKIAQNVDEWVWDNSRNTYVDLVKLGECIPSRILSVRRPDFEDRQFPAQNISIGTQYRKDSSIIWKRAATVYENSVVFGKYVDPNDIQVGKKSSQNFVSILSCLAERERNIKRLIGNQVWNKDGFYWVRLFINSAWRYYAVDDYLAEMKGELVGASSFDDEQVELSPALIEKAYAKAYGSYQIFDRQTAPQEYLRDLTGGLVTKMTSSDPRLSDKIIQALMHDRTIVAVPRLDIEQLGMNCNFNLGVINIGEEGQLEIRNSWGSMGERNGQTFSRQGVFQLKPKQIKKYIDHFLIVETHDDNLSTTLQSRHRSNFYSCYTFKLTKSFTGRLSLSQWERRLFPESAGYQYSAVRLVVEKRFENHKSEYMVGGFKAGDRNLDVDLNLSAGLYAVYCIGWWGEKNYDYNLSISGNQKVEFAKSPTTRVPNLIQSCMESVNLMAGKRTSKGQTEERLMLHKDTNMLLLTLTNTGKDSSNFTQDLSSINFDTLQVITAAKKEEGDLGKKLMKAALAEIKAINNSERVWSVTLCPNQSYTWVISTSCAYSEDSLKKWGFR